MPLTAVNHVQVRPDRMRAFEASITELGRRAAHAHDRFHWTTHQTLWGVPQHFSFVYRAESFEDIEKLGSVAELFQRAYGDETPERFAETNACIESNEHIVLVDRSDLSYPPHGVDPSSYPYAAVTQVRGRPGHSEACEELIRKLAEAIPKAEDPAHLTAYQNYFGNLSDYWIVRPLTEVSQLDHQLTGALLLEKAFGAGEGGLLWRAGTDAVEFAHRELLTYRPEMSNPA